MSAVSYRILSGNNRETLQTLDDKSIQTVITSPPYYGLRRYSDSNDEIGIEETPEQYIDNLCGVFDIIHSKLKDDGTLWINLGDTYSSNVSEGVKKFGSKNFQEQRPGRQDVKQPKRKITGDLKPKDLIGIPWMFAFEMRKRGWYLRQDIIWKKGNNPMPESVEDRCTKAHEYIFLLSKSENYYFDFKSISEKSDAPVKEKKKKDIIKSYSFDDLENDTPIISATEGSEESKSWEPDGTRRKRSVWDVPPSCGEAIGNKHVATYPTKLVEPCVFAGSKLDDLILDPFSGSGTTGVVALNYGRNYIGCELNKEYELISEKRLSEAKVGYNLSQGII